MVDESKMVDKTQARSQKVYLTPDVYLRPRQAERRDIRLVRTDVAGFVGFTERGPLPSSDPIHNDPKKLAIRLTSWKDFLTHFGGFIASGCLAYAVRAFFDNGGTTCYVVRVAATNYKAKKGDAEADTYKDRIHRPKVASFALPGALPSKFEDVATLVDAANDKALDLKIQDSGKIQKAEWIAPGDLVRVSCDGLTRFLMVVDREGDVIRIAKPLDRPLAKGAILSKYKPALVITASSEGSWGNRIRLTLTPFTNPREVTEFALRVTLDPGLDSSHPVEEEFYNHLSLDEESDFYAPERINDFSKLIRVEVIKVEKTIEDEIVKMTPRLVVEGGLLSSGQVRLEGGRDGLDKVTANDFTGGPNDLRGLRVLEEIDEISVLCAPDVVFEKPVVLFSRPPDPPHHPCDPLAEPPEPLPVADKGLTEKDMVTIYGSMIDQCERLRDRVALIDPPAKKQATGDVAGWQEQTLKWSELFITRFGALYYPWLKVADPLGVAGPSRAIPPSGHIAGIFARTDNQFGVHHPPANAVVDGVTGVTDEVTSLQQELLNPSGINAIRSFPGRGILVWGARSLAGRKDPDWRFIHVRRLMSMIEESVEDSTQWAVFEPNDAALRRTLKHSLSVFLQAIWRQGGLKGARPSEGFYVKCDEVNNPPAVVDAGQIICEVGVAVAAPMEFLVFEIRQKVAGAEFLEQ